MIYPCLEKASWVGRVQWISNWPSFQVGDDGYADLLHSLLDNKTQRMCVYPLLRSANIADIIGRYLACLQRHPKHFANRLINPVRQ